MFKGLKGALTDLIYPPSCSLCKKRLSRHPYAPICEGCLNRIESNPPPFCGKCGANLKEAQLQAGVCGNCRNRNYYFKRAWSPAVYKGAMEELIHMFKYRNKPRLAGPLAGIMVDFMQNYNLTLKGFDLLAAVPLHPSKLREREYNQAQLLAQNISAAIGIPCSEGNLLRLRPTKPQSDLSAGRRWDNVAGAFSLKAAAEFKNKKVLIIDDLLTTGATCNEVAKTLQNAGAGGVYALTLSIAQ